MYDHEEIIITITLKTVINPIHDTSRSREQDGQICEFWAACRNPLCYEHGCLKALDKQGTEVHS